MDNQNLMLVLFLLAVAGAVVTLLLWRRTSSALSAVASQNQQLQHSFTELQKQYANLSVEAARLTERCEAIPRLESARDSALQQLEEVKQAATTFEAQNKAQENAMQTEVARGKSLQEQLDLQREKFQQLKTEHADATAHLQHASRANSEMQAFLLEAKARLSESFAELAGKAFDERSKRAAEQSRTDLDTILKPFSERLNNFRERIDTLYQDEAKERRELAGAVNALKTLNENMAGSADALTRALKGNAKVRGDWGELMLENVLRGSGLEEGSHYDRQKRSTDEDGKTLQPDIIVRLPDDRRVVIDSKVNLIAWQEAMNADSPEEQLDAMRRHAVALRQHVKDLAERNYPKSVGESALDITLAFVPIEGALSAALGADADLQSFAFERRVAFASPNTLMAVLRVVERLWTRDKIQKQALDISEAGGKVLDALQGFLSDFDQVGKKLSEAQTAFNSSRNRLTESNQAVIPRARRLVELGARGKKVLVEELKPETQALQWISERKSGD
ncbi:DNA recombination protein RmuC [Solilutibacter tolerans]|uniref:DNA recombination protein RmuC n=1 Tax=Solilutibacter tolerans TaxID=1604334 RepID=A0A1N6RBG0_9GAMM|nr:DNA recombination protein RmuC [Lysobacter tolerans]SIQ26200.1 DNA recombination protein RmuC [Lysobacter tolerans]